jgi:hypothetical protein
MRLIMTNIPNPPTAQWLTGMGIHSSAKFHIVYKSTRLPEIQVSISRDSYIKLSSSAHPSSLGHGFDNRPHHRQGD